jgi:signal transduction histidine kinase
VEEILPTEVKWKQKIELALKTLEIIFDTTNLVQESCNVALETLNDALTFDKIDENKLVLEKEFINPVTYVAEIVRPFQINANIAGVSLVNKVLQKKSNLDKNSFDNLAIVGDKFKLNQVIRNLLSNAIKFTPPQGNVIVTTEVISVSNRLDYCEKMVRIMVKDTGCGMSKENLPKLFGQYVQFNAGALQKGGGSGLGLWISKSRSIHY